MDVKEKRPIKEKIDEDKKSYLKFHIGCAGWQYKDWIGPFYPYKMKPNHFLQYYSKYFDVVEVNSTFYNLMDKKVLRRWSEEVPPQFKFIIKVWNKITHEKMKQNGNLMESDLEEKVYSFLDNILVIKNKISAFLLQFPPGFKYSKENYSRLDYILQTFRTNIPIAIELRDNSWFEKENFDRSSNDEKISDENFNDKEDKEDIRKPLLKLENLLNKHKNTMLVVTFYKGVSATLIWQNVKHLLKSYLRNNSRLLFYFRFIGDRSIEVFNRRQRKNTESNQIFQNFLEEIILYQDINKKRKVEIADIFIIFNNHYSGFAPDDAFELNKHLNLDAKDFHKQRNLMEFF